jgi:hypothetical protein
MAKEDIELENAFFRHTEKERKENDRLYAEKQVEKITYGIVGVILLAVATALINLVIRK